MLAVSVKYLMGDIVKVSSQENLSRGLQDEKCNRFVQNLWSAPSKGHRACVVSNSAGPDSSQSRSKVSRKLLGAKQHSQ